MVKYEIPSLNHEYHLKVSDIHTLYIEESGNPNGNPVLFVHGGPGGGTSPKDRTFFDPNAYRIILFDQRGAGKSTPSASLEDNNTWALVSDIEKIRNFLNIDKWLVFGGSWGSTLALVYAEEHPDRVKALILRGIFMLRHQELQFFYQSGTSFIFPEYYDEYSKFIPENERNDLITAYYKRLTSDDETIRLDAAKHWSKWECATSCLLLNQEKLAQVEQDQWALQFARIESHYFYHKGFFKTDAHILENIHKIRHIPGNNELIEAIIVQGRYDVVCPATSAWELKKHWPEAELFITAQSGHSATEPETKEMLLQATEKFKTI